LARSGKTGHGRRRSYYFLIPIIAFTIIVGSYFASVNLASAPAAMDYTLNISIQISNPKNNTQATFALPQIGIGIPGGFWANHTFDAYGINGYYPVYVDVPPNPYPGYSPIHVKSRISYNYTLGDLFNVWGQPLGQNNTLNVKAQGGSVDWTMCVGTSPTSLRPGLWAQQRLVSGIDIILSYARPCV
jgi:hypothetical protein